MVSEGMGWLGGLGYESGPFTIYHLLFTDLTYRPNLLAGSYSHLALRKNA